MNRELLQVLVDITAGGGTVNDVVRVDAFGEHTNIGVTWPGDTGITRYVQGFNEDESALANTLRSELETRS